MVKIPWLLLSFLVVFPGYIIAHEKPEETPKHSKIEKDTDNKRITAEDIHELRQWASQKFVHRHELNTQKQPGTGFTILVSGATCIFVTLMTLMTLHFVC